jgi:hypothetical protein
MDLPRPRDPREWQETSFEYWPDPLSGPWLVTVGWREIRGRWEPIGIKVEATEPRGPVDLESHILTAKLVQDIPVGALVKSGRHKLRAVAEMVAGYYEEEGNPKAAHEVRDYGRKFEARAGRPPVLSDDFYREVAEIWMEAWHLGNPTTKAVQEHYSRSKWVSYPTASRWCTEARNRGFLPAYDQLRTGIVNPDKPKEDE